MITTRSWWGISSPDCFINSDTPRLAAPALLHRGHGDTRALLMITTGPAVAIPATVLTCGDTPLIGAPPDVLWLAQAAPGGLVLVLAAAMLGYTPHARMFFRWGPDRTGPVPRPPRLLHPRTPPCPRAAPPASRGQEPGPGAP